MNEANKFAEIKRENNVTLANLSESDNESAEILEDEETQII